ELFHKLGNKKQVDKILEEAELLIIAPILVDKRLLSRFEYQKRSQVDINTFIEVEIGKTTILDTKFDEHGGDEYFGEVAVDDLRPVEIPEETLDMDFAKNLMYLGNKCFAYNRNGKGNKLFIEGLSKLKKLPTSEEKAKYLLSFAEDIGASRDKKLVYTHINKALEFLRNTPEKYYVQEEKIQDTIRAISRSLYFLGEKLKDKNLINKSDELSAKIDDSPYKDELSYKSINDLILSKEYTVAAERIAKSYENLKTIDSKIIYDHSLTHTAVCELKIGYMLQDSKHIENGLSNLEFFFNTLEEPFMGHSDFWVILTHLSESGLFFTHEIVQSLVEIASTNFDDEGTVTCLAKLASTLAHGGRWAKCE
ncbi:MAG: hypothetical protein KAJ51_09070, partial [Thermoplasmata archaeon]|nr:hypothetical protein [Thermoplasmata archaeon]